MCRELYNAALQERIESYKTTRKGVTWLQQQSQLPAIKEVRPEFKTVYAHTLNVKGLAGGMLAKSVHDAGWGGFLQILAYNAEGAGRRLFAVDPRGTSQTCTWGAKVPKRLPDRKHVCTACGLIAPRDHVSAQVILQRAGTQPLDGNVSEVMLCVV
jgi:transposase